VLVSSLDIKKYKDEFIEEVKEHIQILNQSLLDFERDSQNREVLNEIFRSAHTLKGSSAMMGYNDMAELTHAMEDVFDNLRKGAEVPHGLLDTLFECVDMLEKRINKLEKGIDEEIDFTQLVKKLENAVTVKTGQETVSKREKSVVNDKEIVLLSNLGAHEIEELRNEISELKNGEKCFFIHVTLSDECTFRSVRAFLFLNKLEEIGRIVKSIPDAEEIENGSFDSTDFYVIVVTKHEFNDIESCIKGVSEVSSVEITELSEGLLKQKKNILTEIKEPSESKRETLYAESRSIRTIRVHTEQLDKLMNLTGELVINKIQLLKIASDYKLDSLRRTLNIIDGLISELQDVVMRIRLVPVEHVFNRFPRLVRDLSRREGKEVNFIVRGKEIEVDRTVLDEIGEPLIHLLRNALNHGIEPPEIREKNGKPREGTVKLVAERKEDYVIITVEDDGAGIDPERIKKVALERGIISESEAKRMSRNQVINLIFLSGVSTAEKVTETSGRGVGMDVVKTKIESLGGSVHIESEVGCGTRVTLRLPLTLAIIKAMLVKVSDQVYAVPIGVVSEIVVIKRDELQRLGKFDAIKLRENVLPVIQLRELLCLPNLISDVYTVMVIARKPVKFGLIIDSVIGMQEVVTKSLDESLRRIKGVSGVTILGDGRVVLILDPISLISRRGGVEGSFALR